MKIGDYVKLKCHGPWHLDDAPKDKWKVLSFDEETITLKSKGVGGEFTFRRDAVLKVYKKEEVK